MIINLNAAFPVGRDGGQGPLPKQKLFMDAVLDAQGPSYVAYMGGVGSGKSLILCVTMLTQGIMHGGEYIIARQFMPELRRTTMKQFLEVCPPELIVEHRIADAEIHIKSAVGKPAVFYFVGLDEPGKLRSLTLSGFGIDEATQVSEEAFLLLQSRLRNAKGLRKGILVGNPAGHDWIYSYFLSKKQFNNEAAKSKYRLILAPSTENVHLPDGYIQGMLDSYSKERIDREIMASFDSFAGQIYNEFDRNVHVIEPFEIPKEWTRLIGGDHGFVAPAAFLWGAVDYDGDIYIYKEFYQREWLIEEIVKGHSKTKEPGLIQMNGKDKVEGIYLDPSTKRRVGQRGASDWDAYLESMPSKWPLLPAFNDVTSGIDRVKSYLKIHSKTHKPRLYIFNTCHNLLEEIVQYRWDELSDSQKGHKNEKEQPKKYKDHACDALRYLIMSRPDSPSVKDVRREAIENGYYKAETAIQQELENIKRPKVKDPFGF